MSSRQFIVATAVGLLVVLPFVILEAVTTSGFSTFGFPFALFAVLWILASVFTGLFLNMVRNIKAGSGLPINLAATAVLLIVIAAVWSGLVYDQMPCFMGVPNCD